MVRAVEDDRTTVEALDPQVMVGVTGNEALEDVAKEAATKLATALSTLVN